MKTKRHYHNIYNTAKYIEVVYPNIVTQQLVECLKLESNTISLFKLQSWLHSILSKQTNKITHSKYKLWTSSLEKTCFDM